MTTPPPNARPPSEAFDAALTLHRQGRLLEAESLYRSVLEVEPAHFGALHHLGVIHAQQGKLGDAIQLIRRALDKDRRSVAAWSDLGVAYEMAKRHAEAIPCHEQALALSPDHAEASFNLGNALAALERHEEAVARFEAAIELQRDHADAHNNLGRSQHALGRHAQAVVHFEQALALKPHFAEAENNLGTALQTLDRHREAIEHLRRALALKPDHAKAQFGLGTALLALGRYEESLGALARASVLNPDAAEIHHLLGTTLQRLKRYDEAIGSYGRALALKPNYALAHFNLGNLLHFRGWFPQAIEHFKTAIALDPDYPGNARAQHLCVAFSGEHAPPRASDEYIRREFDSFAETFDARLEGLEYRVPQLLMSAVVAAIGGPIGSLDVLDAGCGTGLCGPLLRPYARRLAGVDLSEGMLAKARERTVYDELVAMELTAFLGTMRQAYDLILCADTLVYFGDLAEVATAASAALRQGGVLAFSLERLAAESSALGYRLEKHGRYSHSENYVREIIERAGFAVVGLQPAVPRIERGAPVPGLLVVARK